MIYHEGKIYYSLNEIAPAHLYSPEYLRVRIYQGKLRGVKFGGVWHSTMGWLREYMNYFGGRVEDNSLEIMQTDNPMSGSNSSPIEASDVESSLTMINLDSDVASRGNSLLERALMSENNFLDTSGRSYSEPKNSVDPGILITFSREVG